MHLLQRGLIQIVVHPVACSADRCLQCQPVFRHGVDCNIFSQYPLRSDIAAGFSGFGSCLRLPLDSPTAANEVKVRLTSLKDHNLPVILGSKAKADAAGAGLHIGFASGGFIHTDAVSAAAAEKDDMHIGIAEYGVSGGLGDLLPRRGSLALQTLEVLVGHVVDNLSAFGKRVGF